MFAVLNRFKEPSSYAGIAAIAAVAAPTVDPGVVQNLITILAAMSGIVAFFLKDRG